jgi:membrane-associated protease RseP (regulator of RpoE activity)
MSQPQREPEREPEPDSGDDDERSSSSRPPLGELLSGRNHVLFAGALFALTCVSTTWVGSWNDDSWISGLAFSVPLMAILLAHEFGHYIAARIHRVPASLPLFIPMPFSQIGTMGALILMGGRIASRNALLDIGAAGPLAGMAVALPVLIYGIVESPVAAAPSGLYMQEGHSLLYVALLRALKGPFGEGQDIMLTPTAFAGWVGLLVTMINLIPTLQLDGGHVAYALFGERYHRMSRWVRRAMLPLALLIAALYALPALQAGKRGDPLYGELQPAFFWLVWWVLLSLFARGGGEHEHPLTDPGPLSPRRRWLARGTLLLFVLLFMPAWMRTIVPQ